MQNSISKSKETIESMFDEIAPSYDKLNHLFTLNIDIKWRKEIIKYLSKKKFHPYHILDLASGTGDLTKQLLNLNPQRIFSADISKNMLEIQRKKISDKRLSLVHADALNLQFPDNSFELVTIGFGVRNFENLVGSLKEIYRIMKSDAKLVILEMFRSGGLKTKMFNLYFGKVMPLIGNKISGSKYAYSYLFKSVNNFYSLNDFIKICEDCGFELELRKNNLLDIVNTVYLVKS